jgi:hypothetical protein
MVGWFCRVKLVVLSVEIVEQELELLENVEVVMELV